MPNFTVDPTAQAKPEAAARARMNKLRLFFMALIFCGVVAKFYGITDPWKIHDHYNFGGVHTTAYAECLQSTPLAISKGIPHRKCWSNTPEYYPAHPPTILFAMWGWSEVFGHAEWAYRLFTLTFSALNILAMFFIAREARPRSSLFPWIVAAVQSITLGGMYFGTHLDFISEFTVFFVLLMALAALKRKMTLASCLALTAGVSAWPGYISFAPLWAYAWLIGKGRRRVFAFGAFGFVVALVTMMWLHQTFDIVDFLKMKLFKPGYVDKKHNGWRLPFVFVSNFFFSQSRLLGPLLAVFAFFELLRREGRDFFTGWKNRWRSLNSFHHAVLLSGGTGFCYALIGHEYFIVHVFLYLLLLPGLSLLAARFIERLLTGDETVAASTEPRSTSNSRLTTGRDWVVLVALGVLFIVCYPYGIFKTNAVHDALTSVVLASTALAFLYFAKKERLRDRAVGVFCAFAFLGNLSQLINYRNEPDTERSFCEKAREEFKRTGQPVHTTEPRSDAKDLLYCKDLPVIYDPTPTSPERANNP